LGLGVVGIYGILASRLYYLQVVKSEDYRALSDNNRFNFNITLPSRGRILDRYGESLAVNRQDYRLILIPEQVKDLEATLKRVSLILPLQDKTVNRIKKDIKENASFVPILIDDHLDWKTFATLNLKTPELPGIIPEVGEGRAYPHEGRIVREWPDPKDEAKHGQDVWLTVDAELQKYAAELFEEDSGGVAVIDVVTGELRTLLSYPPASTFKMTVMLAALESGLVSPDDKIFCVGKLRSGNRDFHCWRRKGHGPMDMRAALKSSCDVYFYDIAQRVGIDKIANMGRRLGLGQRFDLGIDGVKSGIMPDPAWKRSKLGAAWRGGDTFNAAIGQGFVLATPLQLAVMTARIANSKKAISPHLIIGENLPEAENLNIDSNHIAFVQDAMWSVCQEPGGTAYQANGLGIKGVEMAGKTGTGQVRGISASERRDRIRKNKELPWKLRDHSIFVGFAPYDSPRFAVSCLVEHGGSGAKRAAAISRAILGHALERDGMRPKSEATVQGKPL